MPALSPAQLAATNRHWLRLFPDAQRQKPCPLELAVGVNVPKPQPLAKPEHGNGHDQSRRQGLALKKRDRSCQASADGDTEKGNWGEKGRRRKADEAIKIGSQSRAG